MDMDALIDEICRRVQQKIQALETAKTLLEMGLSIQQIIKATGLSESEIMQLKK